MQRSDTNKALAWDLLVACAATVVALTSPARLVLTGTWNFAAFDWFISVLFLADIAVHWQRSGSDGFATSLRRYGAAWLAVDLVAAAPLHAFPGTASLFLLLRLAKLGRVAQFLGRLRQRHAQHWNILRLVYFLFALVFIVHWLACGWLKLRTDVAGAEGLSAYLWALYWAIQTITTVGYGDITPTNDRQTLYAIVAMIVGVGVYGYAIGNVASLLANIDPAKAHYLESTERLNAFMKYRDIPPELQRRIRDYYAYVWQQRLGYDEATVLSGLPASLMTAVALHLKRDIIQKVPLFQGADDELVREIALAMRPVVFTPGDFVFHGGDHGHEMYFISRGRVDVVARDGTTVITTLGPGEFFGEIALLLSTPRSASVRAVAYCDLYALEKADFDRVVAAHPAFADHIRAMTRERQERGM